MPAAPVTFGFVILYVNDVAGALSFYECAFGLKRRFFTQEGDQAYGELDTGATRLAFASISLAKAHLPEAPIAPSISKPPLAVEIALIAKDVEAIYKRALEAGAHPVSPAATKPWGQTVAYLRDLEGHLIELCSPMT